MGIATFDSDIYIKEIGPVIENIVLAYNSLSVYEAIGDKATKINELKSQSRFWGHIQRTCFHDTIIKICKIYDNGCANYEKNTVHSIILSISKKDPNSFVCFDKLSLKDEIRSLLIGIGACKKRCDFILESKDLKLKSRFLCNLLRKSSFFSTNKNETLKDCTIFRNKKLAHQESINSKKFTLPEYYPEIKNLRKSLDRATALCDLYMVLLDISLPHWDRDKTSIYNGTRRIIDTTLTIDNARRNSIANKD